MGGHRLFGGVMMKIDRGGVVPAECRAQNQVLC